MLKKEIIEQTYLEIERRARKMAKESGMKRDVIIVSLTYILVLVISILSIMYTTKAIPVMFLIMWKVNSMFEGRIAMINVRYTRIANQKIKEALKDELKRGGYIN